MYNSSPLGENKDVTDCLRCCEKRGSNSQKERLFVHHTKHVWEKITDIDNIKYAIVCASKKKTKRKGVQKVLGNIEHYALEIQHMLVSKTYAPSPYNEVIIKDGSSQKTRTIHKPKFYPDQCIHWALVLPMQEGWKKSLHPSTCGSIPNRGGHYGKKKIERWMRNDHKGTKYCYKLDIRKYYQSIDQSILLNMFKRKIKDADAFWLIEKIVCSHNKGLPIGNYTSQWFANLFLSKLDWYISQELGVKYYVRYIDDMVLFSNNKKKLHKIRKSIEEFVSNLGLHIKDNWQVFKVVDRGVDVLGYRFFHTHTLIRKSTAYRLHRRIKRIGKHVPTPSEVSAVFSYMGITSHCDSRNFVIKYILPYVDLGALKELQSENSKSLAIA